MQGCKRAVFSSFILTVSDARSDHFMETDRGAHSRPAAPCYLTAVPSSITASP